MDSPTPPPAPEPTPPTTPPVPAKKLPFNLKVILPLVVMVAALPILAKVVLQRQLTGSKAASSGVITEVRIDSAGDVLAAKSGNSVNLSALAYDGNGYPVTTGAVYQWRISPINGNGQLTVSDNIASFKPGSNVTTGDLVVTATNTSGQASKGLRVAVVDPFADQFSTSPLNPNMWNYSANGLVQVGGGLLGLYNSASAATKFPLYGDFDARVDIYPVVIPLGTITGRGDAIFSFSGLQIIRSRASQADKFETLNVKINGNQVNSVNLEQNQGSVQTRITHRGSIITAYYFGLGNWQELYSTVDTGLSGNAFALLAGSDNIAYFDNFYALVSPFTNTSSGGATPTPAPSGFPTPTLPPTPTPAPLRTPTPTPIPARAIGLWNFNSIKDNTCTGGVNDACNTGTAGSAIDGAKTNMSTLWTVGKYGNALTFDGVNDYVNMGTNSALNLTGKFSVEGWFKIAKFNGSTSEFIASRDSNVGNRGWGMAVSSYKLVFEKGGANLLTSPTILTNNTWYHGAVTFDGATWRMYLNGVLQVSKAGSAILSNTGTQFRVGARQYPGVENYLNGQIDDVRVYNYARSATQVVADMNNQ